MNAFFKATALAAATASLATAVPASAQSYDTRYEAASEWQRDRARDDYRDRERDWNRDRYGYSREDSRRGYRNPYQGEPVYRDTRVWRGNDGRNYCRRQDGTTGLVIGGVVGALAGNAIDGGRERTLGTILGAVGGALLGREVDRSDSRCR